MSDDPNQLIAELPRWNHGDGIDAEGWVQCMGSYELAVGYSLIFWPRFVRFETGTHGTPIRMTDWRETLNWMLSAAP